MPRYRVILEFDHPGSQEVDGAMTHPPQDWNWPYMVGGKVTNLDAAVYELEVVEEFMPRDVRHSGSRR